MKILLLNPPTKDNKKFIREGRCTQEQGVWATLWPPITLVTIAAVLEEDSHEVKVVDCPALEVGWDDLKELIKKNLPQATIWSTGTPSINSDLSLASLIKECDNSIYTAVFGTHVTVLDKQCMEQFPELDFIIRHETEITVRELINALQDKKDLINITGLTFRNSSGEIVANPSRPFIEDLDKLPFPAWRLIDIESYRLPIKGKKYLMISPLRGCPYSCSFCTCQTYYGKKMRKRSVDSVIHEIEHGMSQFGVNDFFFWAETFVLDKKYIRELCSAIIEKGINISWTANSRVDTVDASLLQLMAKSGCWMISFGIESGEQEVLDKSNKGTRVEQVYEAVKMARDAGIKTVGHFILGLPGDTEESMKETINFSKRLDLDLAQFYSAVPFPGSRLYEEGTKEGWIKNSDFSLFNQDHALMQLPMLSPELVNRYRKLAFRKFYFNPERVFKVLSLVNFKDFKRLFLTAVSYMGWIGVSKK